MKVIAFEENGKLVIRYPKYRDAVLKENNLTEDQILEFALTKNFPKNAPYKIMEASDVRKFDRTKRSEWKFCPINGIRIDSQQ